MGQRCFVGMKRLAIGVAGLLVVMSLCVSLQGCSDDEINPDPIFSRPAPMVDYDHRMVEMDAEGEIQLTITTWGGLKHIGLITDHALVPEPKFWTDEYFGEVFFYDIGQRPEWFEDEFVFTEDCEDGTDGISYKWLTFKGSADGRYVLLRAERNASEYPRKVYVVFDSYEAYNNYVEIIQQPCEDDPVD